MNKQKITTQIEIQALVGQAEQALKGFKQSFESAWSSGQPPKSLSKSWEGLRLQLASLKEIAGKEFVNSSDLAQANSDYKSIQKTIHNLKVEFATFSEEQKKALISPEEQKAMKARTAAVEEYTKAIKKSDEVAKQRKNLTTQKSVANTNIAQQKALKAGKEERIVKLRASAPSKSDTQAWIDYTQKIKQLQEEVRSCSQEIRSSENEIDSINKTLSKLKTPEEEFDSLRETLKKLGVEGIDNAENLEQVEKILKKLDKEALSKVNTSLKQTEGALDNFGKEAASIKNEIDKGTEAIERQNQALRDQEAFEAKIKQFLGLAGATEILRRSLRNAFNTTKELDAAMTEMAVVTDLEVGDYWDQLPEHTKRASELGVAIKDVYEAETLYYQQGLKTKDAQALANETLKMARIAGLDAAEATDKMTAALRGFNMELDEASAKKVSDVYSELAAITAADVNEISSAMTKTASIASSAGMEFETTAAFLSQIIETTRESAETAGTAMKTVIARFSEVKKLQGEGLLTGSDEEGEIIDVNKIQTALRSVGISMDEFFAGTEGLDSIFLKLAEKWDTLDVKTQRYIATTAAGSRQQSRFLAMMSDYSRTQELVTAANNSAGASQKQYEKTLESLRNKLAKLKATWDEFSMGILQSDLVKFGVDALTKFLEIINKATSAFNGLGGTITKVLTLIATFKIGQKIFDKIKSPMMDLGKQLNIAFLDMGKEVGKSFAEGVKIGLEEGKKEQTTTPDKDGKKVEVEKRKEALEQKRLQAKEVQKKGWRMASDKKAAEGKGAEAARAKYKQLQEEIKLEEEAIKKAEDERREKYLKVSEPKKGLGEKVLSGLGASSWSAQYKKEEQEDGSISNAHQRQVQTIEEFNTLKKTTGGKKQVEEQYLASKKEFEGLKAKKDSGEKVDKKKYKEVENALKENEKALIDYNEKEEAAQKASLEGWNNVGKGLQSVGATVAGVGVGMSMLGGILQDMGFEEAGEGISKFGNYLTIIGGGISAIGALIPVVAKIAVGAGITVQAAWWWVVLIVAAIAAAIALIAVAIKKTNDAKLENRMKAAAEATEKAKEAAEQAKEAYDDMVEDRKGFDDIQKKLASLTKGTKEWREALRESNAQVLEMIQTYPELAQYMTKGDQGQLTISDEGWDKMVEGQEKAVRNAQSVVMNRQFDELDLKEEEAKQKYNTASQVVVAYDDNGNPIVDKDKTAGLREELEDIYLVQNSSLEEQEGKVEELAKEYGVTTDQIRMAGQQLANNKDELEAIAEQTEAIARANLTAMASQSVTDSEYGDSVVDAFANSLNNKTFNDAVEKQVDEMDKTGDGKSNQRDQEDFKRIAKEYGVSSQMTGKDKDDIKTLYKAVIGTEAGDDMSTDEMLKAIVETDQTNKLVDKMDQYLSKLQDITNIDTRENIAAMLSDDGKGMSRDFAESLFSGDTFDKAKAEEYGKAVFGSMDAWAEATGKSVDELYNEIEKNARDAITINEATFGRLNRVLKKSDNDIIKKFGTSSKVATENAVKLADKLVIATQTAGEEGGLALTKSLGDVLDSAGGEADKVASLIGSMNWSDADSWDKLQEELDVLNISVDKTDLETFINQIKDLGIIVHTVDFNKVSEQIQKMNELIKSIDSGEQGRTFSKESYEMLTAANEDLAGSFVQIGDEFHYLGGSMRDLSTSLKEAAILEAKKAELQLQYQKQISDSIFNFDKNGVANGEGKLKLSDGGYDQWTKEEKISYLENFREYAQQNGVETLSYLTDEQGNSLGLSLGTNFEAVTEENLDQYLKALQRFANENPEFAKEYTEKVSATNVAKNLLLDAPTLVENAQKERLEGNEIAADDYSKALSIQASQSGAVADSIISRYNELVAMDSEDANVEEEMRKLESIMSKGIEKNLAALEKLQQINGYTNEVAAALEAKYQKEIDKLSEVNDSINTANEKLVGKIQEQINQYRQDRDNARKEEEIGKKQSQLAYLLGDTSGASMLQAQALQEQITQDQEVYQDTLIDQGLQKLSDDNAAAAEQRERQIEMMQASLDYNKESGNLTREAENIVISSLREINAGIDPLTTKMYEILYEAEKIDGKVVTQQQQDEFARQFTSEVTPVANALDGIEGNQNDSKGELTSINQLTGDIKTLIDNEKDKSLEEQTNKGLREEAFKKATNAALGAEGKGQLAGKNLQNSSMFNEAYSEYLDAGGTDNKDQFYERVFNKAKKEYDWYGIPSNKVGVAGLNDRENAWFDLQIGDTLDKQVETGKKQTGTDRLNELYKSTVGEEVGTGSVLFDYKDEKLYIYGGSGWYQVLDQGANLDDKKENWSGILTDAALKLKPFKTGGIADFTGPAWLDGTKSHPELVLNARDTENFIQLKDILSEIMNRSTINNSNSSKQDTNYIDIDINVDSIANDYDVEQMADKIRSMLYEDATYRNVNSINLLR